MRKRSRGHRRALFRVYSTRHFRRAPSRELDWTLAAPVHMRAYQFFVEHRGKTATMRDFCRAVGIDNRRDRVLSIVGDLADRIHAVEWMESDPGSGAEIDITILKLGPVPLTFSARDLHVTTWREADTWGPVTDAIITTWLIGFRMRFERSYGSRSDPQREREMLHGLVKRLPYVPPTKIAMVVAAYLQGFFTIEVPDERDPRMMRERKVDLDLGAWKDHLRHEHNLITFCAIYGRLVAQIEKRAVKAAAAFGVEPPEWTVRYEAERHLKVFARIRAFRKARGRIPTMIMIAAWRGEEGLERGPDKPYMSE